MPRAPFVDGYGTPAMCEADKKESLAEMSLWITEKASSKTKSEPRIKLRPLRTRPGTYLELRPKRAGVVSNEVHAIAYGKPKHRSKELVASGPLRLHAYRILALIISQIRPTKDLLDFAKFCVPKNLLWQAIGGTSRPKTKLVELVLKNLVQSVFTVRGEHKFAVIAYMSKAEIDTDTGLCQLIINPEAAPYLLLSTPRNYRRIYFNSICQLRSVYAIALYICLRRFVGLKHQKEHNLSYSDLLEILCVDNPYYTEQWYEFDRNILSPAKDEINMKTELRIKYTVERRGERGAVHSICFGVIENAKARHLERKTLLIESFRKDPFAD